MTDRFKQVITAVSEILGGAMAGILIGFFILCCLIILAAPVWQIWWEITISMRLVSFGAWVWVGINAISRIRTYNSCHE